MKLIYKIFNLFTLNFILGTLTGLIVNTYTGSAENKFYDRATVFFAVALVSTVLFTIVQNAIQTVLNEKINSNAMAEPKDRKDFNHLEKMALNDKQYFKWSMPVLLILLLACSGFAVYEFHMGNKTTNDESNQTGKALNGKLDSMANNEKLLSAEVLKLSNILAKKSAPDTAKKGVKKQQQHVSH